MVLKSDGSKLMSKKMVNFFPSSAKQPLIWSLCSEGTTSFSTEDTSPRSQTGKAYVGLCARPWPWNFLTTKLIHLCLGIRGTLLNKRGTTQDCPFFLTP